jgi:acetylornithine deacetylase/succinyl-diaminopimelate desuccinylase family protein
MKTEEDFVVQVLRELIKIPSFNPPGNEKKIADHIRGILKELNIEAEVDTVGEHRANVTGFLKGEENGPVLVLNGHLDTVPVKEDWEHDPYAGEIFGGRIFGLGTSDMKGAIASMIGAAKNIKESRDTIKGTLILSFVADEERNNTGALHFLEKYTNIDYAVIGEPSNLGIVVSNRGVLRMEITTFGTAGHASKPAGCVNAIYKMNKVVDRLMELAESYGSESAHYTDRPSLAVSLIKGGTAENVVPDRCEITFDRRTVYGEKSVDVEKGIVEILEEIKKNDTEFKYSCKITEGLAPWKAGQSSPLLKTACHVYQGCFQKAPVLGDLGATCEAALFADKGIDTLVFGPGSIQQAHTKDEYVEIDQLKASTDYYYSLIKEILS